jgi:hypothetical protein
MNSEIITHAIESGSEQKEMSKEAKNKYDDIRIKIITNELPSEQILPREKKTPYLLLDTVQMLRYLTALNSQYELHKQNMFNSLKNNDYTLENFKSDFTSLENMIKTQNESIPIGGRIQNKRIRRQKTKKRRRSSGIRRR